MSSDDDEAFAMCSICFVKLFCRGRGEIMTTAAELLIASQRSFLVVLGESSSLSLINVG